ncbi:MAG: PilZ domain-containing protein [Candidatus Rokuibacteriota bacterium]
MRRSQRKGFLERLLSAVYVYPFRCQICAHRFKALQWGMRYVRVDRREFTRIPARLPSTFVEGQTRHDGVVTDLSIAGARLYTGARIAEGELFQLTMQIQGKDAPVAVDAVVVRSANPMRLGLSFVQIKDEDKKRLGQLVQELLSANLDQP